jgi:hypothetical protein
MHPSPRQPRRRALASRLRFKLMGWIAPSRHLSAKMVVVEDHQEWEPSLNEITTLGLDLAKNVFLKPLCGPTAFGNQA